MSVTDLGGIPLSTPLPWLGGLWSQLQGARQAGRLAHGLLLNGPRGVGKRHFAECLAHSLLCRSPGPDGVACGRCPDCVLIEAGNHPDLVRVGPDPESKSGEITIATVRGFTERESLTPSRAPWKIALIDPADRLGTSAANALLKTLEEPAGQTILCLIAERTGALPATIRSRCLQLKVAPPAEEVALGWLRQQSPRGDWDLRLRLAQGAPLRAWADFDDALLEQRRQRLAGFLALADGTQDPLTEAGVWNGLGAKLMLEWLASWICDLVRLMVTEEPVRLENPDQKGAFAALARRIDPAVGHRLLARVLDGRALAESNVNHQLLLESLAIDWARVGQGGQL